MEVEVGFKLMVMVESYFWGIGGDGMACRFRS